MGDCQLGRSGVPGALEVDHRGDTNSSDGIDPDKGGTNPSDGIDPDMVHISGRFWVVVVVEE